MRNLTIALLLACTTAAAQGHAEERAKVRKKMEEISRLMRESERLLHEITRVDRLVIQQQEIVRKLKELEKPVAPAQAAATAAKKEELRNKQQGIQRRLREMFEQQQQTANMTVEQLRQLLRELPRQRSQSQSQGKHKQKQKKKSDEQRLRDKQKEQKQRQDPNRPRDKKDLFKKPRGSERSKDRTGKTMASAMQAWMVSLPPEQQERINRGDLSGIPARYRRLVREYTALRAKREAEEDRSDR